MNMNDHDHDDDDDDDDKHCYYFHPLDPKTMKNDGFHP